MRLSELYDIVIAETGQFLIPKNKLELQEDVFASMIEPALGIYNQYCPFEYFFPISLISTRQFTFTDNSTPYGIPEFISDAIPYGNLENINLTLFESKQNTSGKMYRPFIYRKPTLTVACSADYDVHGVFRHKMVKILVDDNYIYDLPSINSCDFNFIRLAKSKFLGALGRSRRAFTLSDLPITNDSMDMVSEGEALEEKTIEDLRENHHKFYLAWS